MSLIRLLAAIPVALALHAFIHSRNSRKRKIPPSQERVLILGASSGVGKSIARKYARRKAKICVVARRADKVEETIQECRAERGSQDGLLGCVADFTTVEDMIRVRNLIAEGAPISKVNTKTSNTWIEWEGVDTLIVAAGASALKPLLAVAGLESTKVRGQAEEFNPPQADQDAIQRVVDITGAATNANYVGPLIAAVTFIPMMISTSKSPSVLLVSSVAAVIPAPTRAIYASTKSASLLLYQALAIEHRGVNFSFFMPATIEGDFRASAVDGGSVRERDPNKTGLKREAVAERCIQAVDNKEKAIFMPFKMRLGHLLYWLLPSFIEWRASVKYGFEP